MNEKQILTDKINQLRRERKALILAHNYVAAEIQEIADFCGDSLELSISAEAAAALILNSRDSPQKSAIS